MKTQISRNAYRREKRYSGVYQQQGRVITDSDWNELVDTLKERVDEALVDVVGSGSPKGRAAGLLMSGTALKITPGVVYAGGIEGRIVQPPGLSSPFDYGQQADFPAPPPLPAAGTAYRVYADVWERHVGPLEDEGLRDPALHGADTCTRTQTLVQVKWCPTAKNPEGASENPPNGDARLTVRYPQGGTQTGGDPCDPKAQEIDPVGGDFLFRAEVHDVRWPANTAPTSPDRVVLKWSRENGAEQYAFSDMPDWFKTGPWIYEMYDADSERHLGFHLATTNFTPKRGTLVAALPQIAPAGTMVRRWEGYLVLVRTGNVWGVSTAGGETSEDTAGGVEVTYNDNGINVPLGDLDLTLQIFGKVFLPGDFWTVPVRRSTYEAGKKLLDAALPSGIVHRYVTLGEVQANNQLKVRTAQEQRKLAFPRLSELDAGDMGYSTTCTSGLFDNNHDTVKKALDRLCAINATHVGFTPAEFKSIFAGHNPTTVAQALNLLADVQSDDIGYVTSCTSGLFDGTHDTVKKALDRLCAINGTHVGFAKPDNTSVFKDVNPTTVAQALNLLADVKSEQISYTPSQNPQNVHDVKDALDELYARPVQNGSRIYIGQGGDYGSIDVAVSSLLADGKKDMPLALLPGDHTLPASWNPGSLTDVHLGILGLGGAARLNLKPGTIAFDQLASFRLEQTTVIFENASLTFSHCRDVFLTNNILEGSHVANRSMLYFVGTQNVVIRENVIDTQWETQDPNIVNVLSLGAYENIPDLFTVGLSEFRARAHALSITLFSLPSATRTAVGNGIVTRANSNVNLTLEEKEAYQTLGNAIAGLNPVTTVRSWFETIRHLTYVRNPGTSIVLNSSAGPTTIQNNRISGLIGLFSLPKKAATLLGVILNGFYTNFQSGRLSLLQTRYTLQISGNVMAGIRGGESFTNTLVGIANSGSNATYTGMFQTLDITGNVIENEDNLFIAEEVNLHGNLFTAQYEYATPGWLLGSSATVNDNRARHTYSYIHSGIVQHSNNTMIGNNFRLSVQYYIVG